MADSDHDTLAPQEANMARKLISRSSLEDGSFLERARAIPGLAVRSDGELEASLDETLAARPTDAPVWLFGYGSLMWNPAFSFAERRIGTLRGWHRRFCLWLRLGRGTPERPGLMLALDRGGTTRGIAFRLAQGEERAEGSLAEYLFETVAHLEELGIRDRGLERVRQLLLKRLRCGHQVRSAGG